MVPRQAELEQEHLADNRHGVQTLYNAPHEPRYLQVQAAPPEVYQDRDWLIRYAFERVGVSQLAASSLKPSGLDSGAALRTYLDTQSKRFIEIAQAWQEFHVEIARQVIRCTRRIAENDKGYTVIYRSRTSLEEISVADLDLDDSSYVLQVFPISMLPSTPAGKLAALQELRADGTISSETFFRLADFPDLEAERDLQTAPRDLIDKTIDYMLETGSYVPPEPLDNHQMQLSVGLLRYQKARIDGTQEGELELLRRYLTDAQAYLAEAAPPAPAPAPEATPPQGPIAA
jgi:hypothetical protein